MTQTTKEVFETYQVRKTKKQKTAFIDYVQQLAERHGYTCQVEKGAFGVRNIVIGDPDTAKVLYTAHYDTCARLPFPNFITPKNFLIYLLYQILIVGLFFALAAALGFVIGFVLSYIPMDDDTMLILLSFLPQIIYLVLIFLLLDGPAN